MRLLTAPFLYRPLKNLADMTTMATKNTIRVREARRRREKLSKQPLRIDVSVERRTLKHSVRKQRERERAPSLWIMPWIDYTHAGGQKGRVYPPNHLLGLPTEIRQNILYKTYSIAELEVDTRTMNWNDQKHLHRCRSRRTRELETSENMGKSKLQCLDISTHQGKLVTVLSRRAGVLSQVSLLLQSEMKYVSKRWQDDLEAHIQRKLKVQLPELGWLLQPNLQPYMKLKQGPVVKAKARKSGKRVRQMKCWYCTERHAIEDKICPMARRGPVEWRKMTKKLGGWRRREQDKLMLQAEAKKVIFEA